jgi:cytochrome b
VVSNSPDLKVSSTIGADAAAGRSVRVRVRVWDLPLRLFHWLLVLCLIGSAVTAKVGEGRLMEWHYRFGYLALTLVLFRLMWGVVGPRYARFSSFVFSPRNSFAYLRGAADAPRTLGHNPAGALSVFALIAVVAIQASFGLFTSDDISLEGPLARLVSNATVATASWVHHWNPWIILALVVLHIGAILFYRVVRHKSLVKPMVTGDKIVDPVESSTEGGAVDARDDAATRGKALVVVLVAAAIVAVIVNWPLF